MKKFLSKKEEKELFYKWQETGDKKYREQILLNTFDLVNLYLLKANISSKVFLYEDLKQVGYEAVCKAFDTGWHPEKGKFTTYAYNYIKWDCDLFLTKEFRRGIIGRADRKLPITIEDPETIIKTHFKNTGQENYYIDFKNWLDLYKAYHFKPEDSITAEKIFNFVKKYTSESSCDVWVTHIFSKAGGCSNVTKKFNFSHATYNYKMNEVKALIKEQFSDTL